VRIFKKAVQLLRLALLLCLTAFNLPQQASQPNGYDLAAAVNAYRATKGYYQLNPNSLVMAAAQAHAEWIVATGQGGHIGAGGSNETNRVSWTGYGGGASIKCDECWASGGSINDALYGAWTDWTHQEVMLNAWGNRYTDIGGGVAVQGNGRYVFVLDVCLIVGKGSGGVVPGATANPLATADLSNYIYGVVKATPLADGTIKHEVKYGQTLATIAEAYGTTINALRALNNMAADATIIRPEQVLLIKSGTGAAATQATTTPQATLSPTPSATVVIPKQTSTSVKIATAEPRNPTPPAVKGNGQTLRIAGILLVALSGIGLIIVLISVFIKQ
jgi:LysM repeat protein